jgi:hypothetical protein
MIKNRFTYLATCIFLICFVFENKLFGQSYSFNPGKTYITYLDTSESNFGGIEITNTGTVNLNLKWRRVLVDTLIDSRFELCNSGICFLNLPYSGDLPILAPSETGWIKFHLYAGKTEGINTLKYTIKNGVFTADTLTYIIHVVAGITAIKEFKNTQDQAVLYPNPAVNEVTLGVDLKSETSINVVISNNIGQIVSINHNEKLYSGQHEIKINTSEYASGVYSVLILTNNGVINQKLVISK